MSPVAIIISLLAVWMIACAWAGFVRRYLLFVAFVIVGLALNAVWMSIGLQARLLEPNAIFAQLAATIYAICAFGAGWFAGRIRRAWQESRVE